MKETNIVRIKAYVGGSYDDMHRYVCNELPPSGEPSEAYRDKSVRSFISDERYDALIMLLNHYNYATSYIHPNRIAEPWFFHRKCSWDGFEEHHYYMEFEIEVETTVTVHETAEDDRSTEYIKVTREDLARFLKQYKDKEKQNMEDFEKLCSGFFGI